MLEPSYSVALQASVLPHVEMETTASLKCEKCTPTAQLKPFDIWCLLSVSRRHAYGRKLPSLLPCCLPFFIPSSLPSLLFGWLDRLLVCLSRLLGLKENLAVDSFEPRDSTESKIRCTSFVLEPYPLDPPRGTGVPDCGVLAPGPWFESTRTR